MGQLLIGKMSRNWWILIIYGVIAVLFGITALATPLSTALTVTWAIGLFALFEGIISLVSLLTNRIAISKGWMFLYAAVSIIFGLVTLYNPAAMAGTILIFLAFWLIIGGVYRIVFAIQVRKQIKGEWIIIISGLFAIVLGLLLVAQPIVGVIFTTIWFGIIVLVYGLMQIYAGIKLRKFHLVV